MRFPILSVVLLASLGGCGCGYHLAGRGDLIPKTIQTIAVQPFGNATAQYKLARLLPSDISREFIARTRFRIVNDPNEADAVLTGALTNFSAFPIISDTASGRATAVQAIVSVQVKLTNRATGQAIFERQTADYREQYSISLDPATYFDESGTAVERLSKDVAKGMVSAIMNAF